MFCTSTEKLTKLRVYKKSMSSPLPLFERYTRGPPPSLYKHKSIVYRILLVRRRHDDAPKTSSVGLHNTNDGEGAEREQTIYARNGGADDDRDRYNIPYTVAHLDDEAVQPARVFEQKKNPPGTRLQFYRFFHVFRMSKRRYCFAGRSKNILDGKWEKGQ